MIARLGVCGLIDVNRLGGKGNWDDVDFSDISRLGVWRGSKCLAKPLAELIFLRRRTCGEDIASRSFAAAVSITCGKPNPWKHDQSNQ